MVSKKALAEQTEDIAKFMRGAHAAIADMIEKRANLAPVIDSMTSKFEMSETKRPDKGVPILANGLVETFEPVFRDKFASKPGPWESAYDLMVKAKIVTPVNDRGFYDDKARKLAFG
jgi:hemoglobin-like flavoprotein